MRPMQRSGVVIRGRDNDGDDVSRTADTEQDRATAERRGREILDRLKDIRDQISASRALMAERNDLLREGQSLRPKLTQKEMADALGVSDVTVNLIVNPKDSAS